MVLVFLSVAAGALPNDRRLVPVDSDVYRLLRMVRLEAGLSVPWSSRSLRVADVYRQLAFALPGAVTLEGFANTADTEDEWLYPFRRRSPLLALRFTQFVAYLALMPTRDPSRASGCRGA